MFSIPALDNRRAAELREITEQWLSAREEYRMELDIVDQAYHAILPRNTFLKSLPSRSEVLDVGAGDGSLAIQKRWPVFERNDLHLFALSLEVGEHFGAYESYEIKNFEDDADVFPGKSFDAAVCAHFIEHMKDPRSTAEFLSRKIRPGGRVYIEWPHPFTKHLPDRSFFVERNVRISTFNFFDDQTHVEPWSAELLLEVFKENDFALESGGRIHLPWIGGQMRDHARDDRNETRMSLAAWAAFGWAQYLVFNRV